MTWGKSQPQEDHPVELLPIGSWRTGDLSIRKNLIAIETSITVPEASKSKRSV